jgi:hypothetical protein
MHAAAGEFSMVRFNVQNPSRFRENVKPGDAVAYRIAPNGKVTTLEKGAN